MMRFFASRPRLRQWTGKIEQIAKTAESCGRQLRAWADSLQNTDIEGQRHLNEKTRASYSKRKAEEEGRRKFAEMEREAALKLPDGHPFKEALRRKGRL